MADPELKESWRRHQKPEDEAGSAESPVARLPHRVVRSALAYGVLVFLLTAFFVRGRHLPYVYLGWATPLGMVFGLGIAAFDRLALMLRTFLAARCNRAICGFVLFFAYVLGYLLLFSLVVTYPVGYLIEQGTGSAAMAMEYGLYTLNLILFFALLGWLDWGRLVASRAPRFLGGRGRSSKEPGSAKTLDN